MQQGWTYGAGTEVLGQSLTFVPSGGSRLFPSYALVEGHTTTGSQTLQFRYFTASGDTGHKPFLVYNPNSMDDNHLGQTQSVYTVWEIEP